MDLLGSPVFHVLLGLAWAQLDCGNCYHLSTGAIFGVVLGDLILTLLIALAVYYVASCIYQRKLASKELKKTEHESPYEELQGPRLDVYSAIRGSETTYK
ncbi:TYRO protein tyrosine kinase-binding protein isoform X2 [Pogona vitticeps]|uniref:TYRO protein tyrosine kinase-binding protein n=1 Tax=Pogona vitticeps TaxID=103695 RepID=A0A6J0SDD4_9SAUR|nr:TYRO protein tyrosine kinase-binding protein isoform X2 [Pogona vitticeps]